MTLEQKVAEGAGAGSKGQKQRDQARGRATVSPPGLGSFTVREPLYHQLPVQLQTSFFLFLSFGFCIYQMGVILPGPCWFSRCGSGHDRLCWDTEGCCG